MAGPWDPPLTLTCTMVTASQSSHWPAEGGDQGSQPAGGAVLEAGVAESKSCSEHFHQVI